MCWVFGAAQAFSSCGKQGYSAWQCSGSHCPGFSCCGTWALGAWAWLLHGMWDPPGPGLEAVSPASAGGFFTTEPPGKPLPCFLGVGCSLGLSLSMGGSGFLSFSRLAWASLSNGKSLSAEAVRPPVAQALKLTWYHFCHILLIRPGCEISPDSRDGERLYLLMGKLWNVLLCFSILHNNY